MADGRDEKVWTHHADEHKVITPHIVSGKAPILELLKNACPLGSKVLDYGCGSGLWVNLFKDYDYTGMDQNDNMIAVANSRNLPVKFIKTSWNKIPAEDNSFDLIFTAAVIQHNKHPDKKKVLEEFKRILKPGGIYLATENTFRLDNYHHSFKNKPYNEDLDDGYSFTPSGWERFMKPLGFNLLKYQQPSEYVWQVNK